MIPPTDLRLNNLFYHQGRIKKVFSISQTGVFGTDLENGHSASSCTFEEMEPINIDKALLVSLGFDLDVLKEGQQWQVYVGGGSKFDIRFLGVFSKTKNPGLTISYQALKMHIRLKYLHQLQNWFYVNSEGQELEMK